MTTHLLSYCLRNPNSFYVYIGGTNYKEKGKFAKSCLQYVGKVCKFYGWKPMTNKAFFYMLYKYRGNSFSKNVF